MKQYIDAKVQFVGVSNDIVTNSVNTHNVQGNGTQLAPTRQRSIWD